MKSQDGNETQIGIVGAPGIGERHARAYLQDPLAELVGCLRPWSKNADEARANAWRARLHQPSEMLRHETDIVDVSTAAPKTAAGIFEPTWRPGGRQHCL